MTVKPKPLTRAEEKLLLEVAVQRCIEVGNRYGKDWKPINPDWPTVTGCSYIRLSTETQCLVQDGSLVQQVHIVVQEMVRRSHQDKVNYRITRFYVDAGLSGQLDDRPEFLSMESNIKKKRHRFVIIKELPRISRNAARFKKFFQISHSAECMMVIPGFPVNPNDPANVLQLDIMAAVAEYEAKNTAKRVRENVHSAITTSGKFNATHKVLGLDQLIENGKPKVGLYQPNHEELKVVHWIMDIFVKVSSYQVTLQEIEKRGIKNKNGRNFKEHSLTTLLTNLKYIGKWEINAENKNRDSRNLMPYEQYKMIDLPHGCVVDTKLWSRVQATVERLKGNKSKNTRIDRIYPLSGILKYSPDGSSFGGSGNHGKTKRINYYQNTKHRIRLSAEDIESEARKIATEIIKQSPKLREAIASRIKTMRSTLDLLQGQLQQIDAKVFRLQTERSSIDKRLDFLLSTGDSTQSESFRQEYIESVSRIKQEMEECLRQKQVIEHSKSDLTEDDLDSNALSLKANKILMLIQDKDPVALKNAYRALFSMIEVGELDSNGRRQLRFIIRGSEDFTEIGVLPT